MALLTAVGLQNIINANSLQQQLTIHNKQHFEMLRDIASMGQAGLSVFLTL